MHVLLSSIYKKTVALKICQKIRKIKNALQNLAKTNDRMTAIQKEVVCATAVIILLL